MAAGETPAGKNAADMEVVLAGFAADLPVIESGRESDVRAFAGVSQAGAERIAGHIVLVISRRLHGAVRRDGAEKTPVGLALPIKRHLPGVRGGTPTQRQRRRVDS